MLYFVSDLHLGDGGPLEDFALWPGRLPRRKTREALRPVLEAMHARWAAFIEAMLEESARRGEIPEIVLLGDALDLLQAAGELCDPEKIKRIHEAHGPWFEALARAAAAGARIAYVVGNHDHELMHPAVWAALRLAAPYLNDHLGGEPLAVWRDFDNGIHAEHGSQRDPVNAFEDFLDPMALSLGSRIVLDLVNRFEPQCPLLDLMPDAPSALWYALARAPGLVARPLREFLFKTGKAEGAYANLDFLPEMLNFIERIWLGALPRPQRAALRGVLSLITSALGLEEGPAAPPKEDSEIAAHPLALIAARIAPDPKRMVREIAKNKEGKEGNRGEGKEGNRGEGRPLRLVVLGHTHRPGIETLKNGLLLANSGSWKARVRPSGLRRFALEQTLDVVAVARLAGSLEVEVRSFNKP